MTLSEEAREFNEQQKRYREQEHLHKYTAGADHRETMEALSKIEKALLKITGLLNRIVEQQDDRQRQFRTPYRTQRSSHEWVPYFDDYGEHYRTPYRRPAPGSHPRHVTDTFDQGQTEGTVPPEDPHEL